MFYFLKWKEAMLFRVLLLLFLIEGILRNDSKNEHFYLNIQIHQEAQREKTQQQLMNEFTGPQRGGGGGQVTFKRFFRN